MQAMARSRLLTHPLFDALTSMDAWRLFMAHHVFAVWDFMSLLKRLQRDLTCVQLPWTPPAHPAHARLINEIVLEEESDLDTSGRATSHFELYLQAMEQCGANSWMIRRFLRQLQNGTDAQVALKQCGAPPSVQAFVSHTLYLVQHGSTEEVCAAFFWGREEIIPQMFLRFARRVEPGDPGLATLSYYFQRHIELDGTDHGPRARALLDGLTAHDPALQARAAVAAEAALQARYELWSGVQDALQG